MDEFILVHSTCGMTAAISYLEYSSRNCEIGYITVKKLVFKCKNCNVYLDIEAKREVSGWY